MSGPTWKEGWTEATLAAGSAYDLLFRTLLFLISCALFVLTSGRSVHIDSSMALPGTCTHL